MCRILVLFEQGRRSGSAEVASRVARGAEAAGAEVWLQPVADAGLHGIAWADALALAIDGRAAKLPYQVKRWLDALGFSGWRSLADKPACVFAAVDDQNPDADAACRAVARILSARGMQAVSREQVAPESPSTPSGWHALGHTLATRLARRLPPAVSDVQQRGSVARSG